MDILRKKVIDQQRRELTQEVYKVQKDFQEGRCHPATPEEILKEILA
jgi:hypothetical protein